MGGSRFLHSCPYQEAYLLDRARQFRAALGLPLVLLGGITRRQTIDLAMAEGFAFVAMGRALLREPDLLQRMQADPEARSLCIHCKISACPPSTPALAAYSHERTSHRRLDCDVDGPDDPPVHRSARR